MKKTWVLALLTLSLQVQASPKCIAHRGSTDNGNITENSLGSIQQALKLNADGVELDIRHTKDGVALLMHDKKIKRVAKHRKGYRCRALKKKVSNLEWKNKKHDQGNHCRLKDGQKIATLSEGLDILAPTEAMVFIELKDSPRKSTLKLVAEKMQESPERLRVISFKKKFLEEWRHLGKMVDEGFYEEVEIMKLSVLPNVGRVSEMGFGLNTFYGLFNLKRNAIEEVEPNELGVWTVNDWDALLGWIHDENPVDFITTDEMITCKLQTSSLYD